MIPRHPASDVPVAVRDGSLLTTDVRGLADLIALSPEATSRALGAPTRRALLVQERRGRYRPVEVVNEPIRSPGR